MSELFKIATMDTDIKDLQDWMLEQVDENGEIPEYIDKQYEEELTAILRCKKNLIEDVLTNIQEAEALAESHKKLAKTYIDRAKSLTTRSEKLKGIVLDILDGDDFEGANLKAKARISKRCNVEELQADIDGFEIDMADIFTKHYDSSLEEIELLEKIVTIKFIVSKLEAKKLLKSGTEIDGCEMESHEKLAIKLK